LLGWFGLDALPLDLAVVATLASAVGAMAGSVTGLIGDLDANRVRGRAFVAAALLFLAVFCAMLRRGSPGAEAGLTCLLAVVAVVVVCRTVWRAGTDPFVVARGALAVAGVLCLLQLYAAQAHAVERSKLPAFQWTLALSGLVMLAAGLVSFSTKLGDAAGQARRARRALLLGATTWALLWAFVFPLPNRWPVRDGPARIAGATSAGFDVVLIVLDTVRADHLDLFGYERQTMPNLTRLAAEFDVVATTTATSNWTLPSHASMFTGLYPARHGAHRPFVTDESPPLAYPLSPDVETLSEFLGKKGFRTGGISANFGPLNGFGLSRGFQYFDATGPVSARARATLWLYRLRFRGQSVGRLLYERFPESIAGRSLWFNRWSAGARRAEEIRQEAKEWLDSADAEHRRPFFLFLNFLDAHVPYLPLKRDDQAFGQRPDGVSWVRYPSGYEQYLAGEAVIDQEEIDFLGAQYDAELLGLDRGLAGFLGDLKARGRWDQTLIIVTSDHGESFGEHGFLKHGGILDEPQIGIPLLIKLPESAGPPSIQDPSLLQSVDLFPTIAQLLGEAVPDDLDGSAWGVGRDYARSEAGCFACGSYRSLARIDRLREELATVRFGRIKTSWSTRRTGPESFDLAEDPGETEDQGGRYKETEDAAAAVLASREFRRRGREGAAPGRRELDALRDLGYIQ